MFLNTVEPVHFGKEITGMLSFVRGMQEHPKLKLVRDYG